MNKPLSCDIFCSVVDNYGDIGVCWRLARQLAQEHDIPVRLWVDDLASFHKLWPEINTRLPMQHHRGIEVRHWLSPFPEVEPAQWVMEAFACQLPECYVAAMAAQINKPVWINLEHLSAEDWVAGCHGLPSPHPSLPLTKYFFFPGFTRQTGGLLLEQDLIARRNAFQCDPQAITNLWHTLGVPPSRQDEVRVSLFCYENPALPELLSAWSGSDIPIFCLVPEGRALPQVAEFFGQAQLSPGEICRQDNLTIQVLPFMEQERYDELLWACDMNFVRGEDSFVRAQWAARPFVWHIYPQHDHAHSQKLRAFMQLYCARLLPGAAQALQALWQAWNLSPSEATAMGSGQTWRDWWMHRLVLQQHAHVWAQQLSGNDLALNLLAFFRKIAGKSEN